MPDIFGGVEPPRWLTNMTQQKPGQLGEIIGELVGGLADSAAVAIDTAKEKQQDGVDTNWIKELPGSIQPGFHDARLSLMDPLWQLHAQQAQLNMAQQGLQIKNQQSLIDARAQKLRMQEHDQDVLPKWLQDHPTWESRQDAEPPVLFTPEGERMFGQLRMNDANSTKAKAMQGAIHNFTSGIASLQKLNPSLAGQLAAQLKPGQVPTPQLQSQLDSALAKGQQEAEDKKSKAVTVFDEGGKRTGIVVGGKYYQDKPEKPAPTPKLPPGLQSEITFGRERVLGIQKQLDTLNPANEGDKQRIQELQGQLNSARDFYNRKVKEGNEYTKPPATSAPAAAPAAPAANSKDPLGLY